ncbi:MAG: ABC transporter permease [Myxococcota bacterium]
MSKSPPELPPDALPPETVLRPRRGWAALQLRELWDYRELLWFMALRDIKVRYKQSVLGVAWAVIQPLMIMLVFSGLFGLLLDEHQKPTVDGIPYAISTYCALVLWQLFSRSVLIAGRSVAANQYLLSQVYFPRMILPLAPILATLADFAIAFLVLIAMILIADIPLGLSCLAVPLFVLLTVLSAAALSVWLAALNGIYRDVQYATEYFVQWLMFATPVLYTTESIMSHQPPWLRLAYHLNPMTEIIDGFRWALLGGPPPTLPFLLLSSGVLALILFAGMMVFRRMERSFADLV